MGRPKLLDEEGRVSKPAWAVGLVFVLSYLVAHLPNIAEFIIMLTRGLDACRV